VSINDKETTEDVSIDEQWVIIKTEVPKNGINFSIKLKNK